ncbi:DUF488 family protein [Scytonema sp. NUACC26]|uniref:DUF488 domain-containing protein n=1 Tax=Scytonema sp. NUACC26 TaxID=3140176 RepID=UPI0034DBBAA0
MEIFTIGHSNNSIETFIILLQEHKVTALEDVRSHPYSRYLPHFNQAEIKSVLLKTGIRYVFLGRELGARPNDSNCYIDGKAIYENIAATQKFAEGIQRIKKGAENYRLALLCAEKDPITCHRAILVCQHLRSSNLDIKHILSNGDLKNHYMLEERLLDLHNLKLPEIPRQVQLSLFRDMQPKEDLTTSKSSREELLKKAYKLQGFQITYVEKNGKQHELKMD